MANRIQAMSKVGRKRARILSLAEKYAKAESAYDEARKLFESDGCITTLCVLRNERAKTYNDLIDAIDKIAFVRD